MKKDYEVTPSQNIDEHSAEEEEEACDFHLSLAGVQLNKESIVNNQLTQDDMYDIFENPEYLLKWKDYA